MPGRAVAVVALVATVVMAAVLWMRHRSQPSGSSPAAEPPAAASGSGAKSHESPRPSAMMPPQPNPRPVLEVRDAGSGARSFAEEPADPTWAGPQAALVAKVARRALAKEKLGKAAELTHLECRATRCRFDLISHDPARFPDVLAVLEDDRGFDGVARQMSIDAMARNDAGMPVRLTITLRFDRNQPPANPSD